MKKLGIALVALFALSFTSPQGDVVEYENSNNVYICTGPSSKKYHAYPECKGLKKCSKEIKKVSKVEAVKLGRTQCKWCY